MTSHVLSREDCRHYIEQKLFSPKHNPSATGVSADVGAVGVELELFPYIPDLEHPKGKRPVKLSGTDDSLTDALVPIATDHGGKVKFWNADGRYKEYDPQIEYIAFPDGDRFLFEPGGQVEISTRPCNTIEELALQLSSKKEILQCVTEKSKIHFLQYGTNLYFDIEEIGNQLHKPRYKALEKYFNNIGPYGKQMMLQTGALHINLDLGVDESTRIKRIVAANLLVPFTTALFAHSYIIGNKLSGRKSYRSFLWQNLDKTRTGILPLEQIIRNFSKEDLINAYLDFAVKAPIIYIRELGNKVFPPDVTFEYWMQHPIEGIRPTVDDFENHISLLFPEVRWKGYLEIRSVDAPPTGHEMIPVLFYTGLLYNATYVDYVLELLAPMVPHLNTLWASATYGLKHDELFNTSKRLMELAMEGFAGLPGQFQGQFKSKLLSFFENYTAHRNSFDRLVS